MTAVDRVMDLKNRVDHIDLSAMDAMDANSAMAGNQPFTFAGAKSFFGSAGNLYPTATLLGRMIDGDVNGYGSSDFWILSVGDYSVPILSFNSPPIMNAVPPPAPFFLFLNECMLETLGQPLAPDRHDPHQP